MIIIELKTTITVAYILKTEYFPYSLMNENETFEQFQKKIN